MLSPIPLVQHPAVCRAICVVKDEPVVGALMDEYKQAASRLTDLIDTWLERSAAGKPPKRRTVKVRAEAGTSTAERWGAGTSKQDEMEYLLWVANDLKGKVLEAQAQALRQVRMMSFTGDLILVIGGLMLFAGAAAGEFKFLPRVTMC